MGYVYAALAPILVGSGVVASSLLVHVPVFYSQGLRYLIGAVALLPFAYPELKRLPRLNVRDILHLAALTATGLVGFSVAMIEAVRGASPAVVGVIVGCAPIVIAIAAGLGSRSNFTVRIIIAAIVVAGGSALCSGSGSASAPGIAWSILALACDALFSLLSAPLVPRIGARSLATITTGGAGVILLALQATQGTSSLGLTASEATCTLYLGIAVSMGAFLLWYGGLARIPVSLAGLFVGLIPLAALLGQAFVLHHRVERGEILGTLLTVIGIGIGVTSSRASRSTNAHP
jgi:drug/metabolite transporter (DMT)-like permease